MALFTRGLGLRIFMIGTLTGLQWGIYDAYKVRGVAGGRPLDARCWLFWGLLSAQCRVPKGVGGGHARWPGRPEPDGAGTEQKRLC